MNNELSYSFELLGEVVEIETNTKGCYLRITFGDTLIEESFGECVIFPDFSHLSGAALDNATNKFLREVTENSISEHIHWMMNYYRESIKD